MNLISDHSQLHSMYRPTLWAKIFHSVPHVNITLHSVDSKFNPESDLYLESIGILATIPAAWLIATLFVLLIYLCTRCCDTRSSKKRKSRPMRCCLSLFALVTCVALALGLLGNQVVHEGMGNFYKATENINSIIHRSQVKAEKCISPYFSAILGILFRYFEKFHLVTLFTVQFTVKMRPHASSSLTRPIMALLRPCWVRVPIAD